MLLLLLVSLVSAELRLTYFNLQGRAEHVRLLLEDSGVQWKNVITGGDEWKVQSQHKIIFFVFFRQRKVFLLLHAPFCFFLVLRMSARMSCYISFYILYQKIVFPIKNVSIFNFFFKLLMESGNKTQFF